VADFLTDYLTYVNGTESPRVYYRWSAITAIGALLGRSLYIPFGHSKLYPNFYSMLLGDPGAGKSVAIKTTKLLFRDAGYTTFSADRSSREKFLLDLDGSDDSSAASLAGKVKNGQDITEINLWGADRNEKDPAEVFIVADEWNEFVSAGNIDFYTTLGNLWDWNDESAPYTDKVKNSKSVSIYQPTISLLGGNTQENFARAFPPEILGHGFLARLLLIHGTPTGRKITFPVTPSQEATGIIVERIREIQKRAFARRGELLVTNSARALIEDIYISHTGVKDPRFKGYNNRRRVHLLKLCIITSAVMRVESITEEVVIYANTMLSAIEITMPLSIGEFGKSKHSDVSHKIIEALNAAKAPMTVKQLWTVVRKDLDRIVLLGEILNNLQLAEKVQYIKDKGWLPRKEVAAEVKFVDWSLLTEEERNVL